MEPSPIPASCLGVVMPVYNEEETLHRIVNKVLARPEVGELVLVDDGSTDGTWATMQDLATCDSRIRLVRTALNQGKGAALRAGFDQASSGILVIQDADLEYDPDDYPNLLQPILSGQAEVVYGSRFLDAGDLRAFRFWHMQGNRVLTWLSNLATGLRLTDMETCYKMFRKSVIQKIDLQENRFGFEPEFTAKVARLKLAIVEVPVSYRGRTYHEGKKIGWIDGLSAIRCILQYRF